MFLPENIEYILLFCQDNFKWLASKLKKKSLQRLINVLVRLYIYVSVTVHSGQLYNEARQLVSLHIYIQGFIEENPKFWVDQSLRFCFF